MRRLINVLKTPPSTHIVDKNGFVIGFATYYVLNESGETRPVSNDYSALSCIGVRLDYGKTMLFGIFLDRSFLIVD